MRTFNYIQGTTYRGMAIELLLNSAAMDLTGATITAKFESCCGKYTKLFSIGNGITDIDALNGKFNLLKNTVLIWSIGKWLLTITVHLQNGDIKKPINKNYQIWIQ